MSQRLTQFAYGANTYDDCPCPATAAGYDVDTAIDVAERYDHQLKESPSGTGTVDMETAKEAWLQAIDYWRETTAVSEYEKQRANHAIEIGEQIADELGWL